jgi:hypothetical protein
MASPDLREGVSLFLLVPEVELGILLVNCWRKDVGIYSWLRLLFIENSADGACV